MPEFEIVFVDILSILDQTGGISLLFMALTATMAISIVQKLTKSLRGADYRPIASTATPQQQPTAPAPKPPPPVRKVPAPAARAQPRPQPQPVTVAPPPPPAPTLAIDRRAEDVLRRILHDYPEMATDPRRCRALLNDLLAGECQREINVLVMALGEGVPQVLQSRSALPRPVIVSQLSDLLVQRHALHEDAARWAVNAWASALAGEKERPTARKRKPLLTGAAWVVAAANVLTTGLVRDKGES